MALPSPRLSSRPTGHLDPAPPGAGVAHAEAVEVYRRTYTTVLRSSGETRLRVLEASHKAMRSSLHALADSPVPDLGAFLYAVRRLPETIFDAQLVVMGQSAEIFQRRGFGSFTGQPQVVAPGRRRRWYDDGRGVLAVLIASASDVDDLVPTLVAFQIEWNKLHAVLTQSAPASASPAQLAACCGNSEDDWLQLEEVWGNAFAARLEKISGQRLSLRLRMLGGTEVGYARVTRRWWQQVTGVMRSEGLLDRPLYFVSSNSHSLGNLVTGLARRQQTDVVASMETTGPAEVRDELRAFQEGRAEGNWDNLLYYASRLWQRSVATDAERLAVRRAEREAGVIGVGSRTALDVSAQLIALDRLDVQALDERLRPVDAAALRASRAVIVNVDYPLGLAAYNILREVAETAAELRGVYILGKAATLNADVGDVMISNVIHDEHSGNSFWLDNAFRVSDIAPYLRFGSGLDNQRAVTVKGTFLQNRGYLDYYHREAFSVVEMEAGPYCCAMYEMSEAARYPMGEPVNFARLPVDFGVIHYASDTPYTQARTLGARGLSYFGMDSTYASSVAILRRILRLEGALTYDGPALDAPAIVDAEELPAGAVL
ncbi:MAG: hypothetical protein JF887_10050 [Candidatus Dormibacteraeota bacterium]|uniref:Uncharacterized protein n=1 Tax=Candidatus Amunia macphersoniae TaxID=3127014 RepID=A0A934KJ45_9BACT|nr:hypothetical protein [Candidatus Dormibacteraeota bacterium]